MWNRTGIDGEIENVSVRWIGGTHSSSSSGHNPRFRVITEFLYDGTIGFSAGFSADSTLFQYSYSSSGPPSATITYDYKASGTLYFNSPIAYIDVTYSRRGSLATKTFTVQGQAWKSF